jgi:hypothetical protein
VGYASRSIYMSLKTKKNIGHELMHCGVRTYYDSPEMALHNGTGGGLWIGIRQN